MFRAVHDGRIKALWIMATNPAVSMPEADRVARAIADADGNSRPGCVYVKLAEAAMAAGGAK